MNALRDFRLLGFLGLVVSMTGGCKITTDDGGNGDSDDPGTSPAPVDVGEAEQPQCAPPPVDRFKELAVVDPTVVDDPARTAADGPWSFAHAMDGLRPEGTDAAAFVEAWFGEWSMTEVNCFAVAPKTDGVTSLLAGWPRTEDGKLDLTKAPMKLIGITNRLDLRDKNDPASAGEGRLIFAVTTNGTPSSFTIIFEYTLPTSDGRDAAFWANQWHALGALPFGERYNAALEGVTRLFTDRDAAPGKPNGSAIGQVRTNEILLGSPWELREFRLAEDGALRIAPTLQCPDVSLNDGPALVQFVQDHAEEVRRGTHVLPREMLGGVAVESSEGTWRLSGVDEELRHAFALQTCNGCHNGETRSKDGFYHVAPSGIGAGRLSAFMNDPADPTSDELARRAGELSLLLCNVSQDHNPPSSGPGTAPIPDPE